MKYVYWDVDIECNRRKENMGGENMLRKMQRTKRKEVMGRGWKGKKWVQTRERGEEDNQENHILFENPTMKVK